MQPFRYVFILHITTYLFIHLFVHLLICLFVHSFIHLFNNLLLFLLKLIIFQIILMILSAIYLTFMPVIPYIVSSYLKSDSAQLSCLLLTMQDYSCEQQLLGFKHLKAFKGAQERSFTRCNISLRCLLNVSVKFQLKMPHRFF